jgi:hypothetical protein
MRDSQKLKPEFSEYLTILIKLFNQVIEQENIETLLQKQIKVSIKSFINFFRKENAQKKID